MHLLKAKLDCLNCVDVKECPLLSFCLWGKVSKFCHLFEHISNFCHNIDIVSYILEFLIIIVVFFFAIL